MDVRLFYDRCDSIGYLRPTGLCHTEIDVFQDLSSQISEYGTADPAVCSAFFASGNAPVTLLVLWRDRRIMLTLADKQIRLFVVMSFDLTMRKRREPDTVICKTALTLWLMHPLVKAAVSLGCEPLPIVHRRKHLAVSERVMFSETDSSRSCRPRYRAVGSLSKGYPRLTQV